MDEEKKTKKEERKRKAKKFLTDHKWEIIGTIAGITVGEILLHRYFKFKKQKAEIDKEGKRILEVLESSNDKRYLDWTRKIDEDIFVDLAPELESMVLCEAVEKGWMERTYDLGKGGSKLVTINIEKVS